MHSVRLPALLYLAAIGFSERKEMSGHLLLRSSVGGCVVISQNLLLTWQCQNKILVVFYNLLHMSPSPSRRARFIFLIPARITCSQHLNIQLVSWAPGSAELCSRKESLVTNLRGKWQRLLPVNRLTWREVVKEGKRKWRREGEAGGVWHYSITIRAVLDFPHLSK